jgi:hypothetical protein
MIIFIIGFTIVFIPFLDIIFYEYIIKIIIWIFVFDAVFLIWVISWILDNWNIEEKKISLFKKILNFFYEIKDAFMPIFLWFLVYSSWYYLIFNSKSSLKPILNIDPKYAFWIISLFIFSFLYFSIIQYSKAKQLRIENQNKIALLHWYIAIKTDLSSDIDKWRFYDNIANVVFTSVYNKKEADLPFDKIVDLINKFKK